MCEFIAIENGLVITLSASSRGKKGSEGTLPLC